MNASSDPPGDVRDLEKVYQEHREQYGAKARRSKRRYQRAWRWAFLCTWLTLFSAMLGMTIPENGPWEFVVLNHPVVISDADLIQRMESGLRWAVRGFSVIAGGLTAVQLMMTSRARWTRYRAASERLKSVYVRYRCGLPPFDGPDADHELQMQLAGICELAELRTRQAHQPQFRWGCLSILLRMPEDLRQDYDDVTTKPIRPRFLQTTDGDAAELAVRRGRLLSQRKWYFTRSKRYGWTFVAFQGSISLFNATNVAVSLFSGGVVFGVAAIVTIVNLALMGYRDFMDCRGLFLRYAGMALRLQNVQDDYDQRRDPFNKPSKLENVRLLAEHVEDILSAEFEYWYASQEGLFGTPARAGTVMQPRVPRLAARSSEPVPPDDENG